MTPTIPILISIICLLLYSYTSMEKIFERERKAEIEKSPGIDPGEVFAIEKISTLPAPIQKYLTLCGYLGRPMIVNADVIWKESFIKLQPDKEWSPLYTRQFNAVYPPVRLAYMNFLSMPVSGRDKYKGGKGEMKGKLFNMIPVINGKGREISQSALITIFCEFLFIPGYVFQENVRWETLEDGSVEACLRDGDFEVRGVFYFDEKDMFTRFETNDRYFSRGKNDFVKTRFSAQVHSYQTLDGLQIAKDLSIVWHLEEGDYEYYKGSIERIDFNVRGAV